MIKVHVRQLENFGNVDLYKQFLLLLRKFYGVVIVYMLCIDVPK